MSENYLKNNNTMKWKKYLLGLMIGILVTFTAAAVFALVMYFFELDSSLAVPLASVSIALGSFIASYITAKKIGDKGYLVGAVVGAAVFAVLTVISLIASFDGIGINTLLRFIIIILASMIGGILGVNKGKNKKYI